MDYAIFQNAGYRGLYGELTASDIKARRNLGKNENIQGKEKKWNNEQSITMNGVKNSLNQL